MNPFNAISFAVLCGALASPAAMAQEFISQPAPVLRHALDDKEFSDNSLIIFAEKLSEGKTALASVTDSSDEYYLRLISVETDVARVYLEQNGTEIIEACEMFLRAFETLAEDIPDFVSSEMKVYWRHVAKARSAVTRLNNFAKGLFVNAETFESQTDLNGIRELAAYTTEKMSNVSFH